MLTTSRARTLPEQSVPANVRAIDDVCDATADAEVGLELGEEDFLHFPWPTLDAAIGGIGPNRVTLIAAPPEGGKTAFTLSLLDGWAEQGVKLVCAFLETPPDVLLQQWACFRLGINYEHIGTGAYLRWSNARDVRLALVDEIRAMAVKFRGQIWLHSAPMLSVAVLDGLFADAIGFDADALLVDHVDHTDDGATGRGLAESNAILTGVSRNVRTAKSYGSKLRFVGTSQMNNDAVRRGGVFGRAMPPVASDVLMGPKKEQIVDLMLGLHRIRRPVTEDDKQLEKDIKEGRRALADALLPNTVGVRIMKRRVGGGSGVTIPLGFERGRVVEPGSRTALIAAADKTPDDVFDPTDA